MGVSVFYTHLIRICLHV